MSKLKRASLQKEPWKTIVDFRKVRKDGVPLTQVLKRIQILKNQRTHFERGEGKVLCSLKDLR